MIFKKHDFKKENEGSDKKHKFNEIKASFTKYIIKNNFIYSLKSAFGSIPVVNFKNITVASSTKKIFFDLETFNNIYFQNLIKKIR